MCRGDGLSLSLRLKQKFVSRPGQTPGTSLCPWRQGTPVVPAHHPSPTPRSWSSNPRSWMSPRVRCTHSSTRWPTCGTCWSGSARTRPAGLPNWCRTSGGRFGRGRTKGSRQAPARTPEGGGPSRPSQSLAGVTIGRALKAVAYQPLVNPHNAFQLRHDRPRPEGCRIAESALGPSPPYDGVFSSPRGGSLRMREAERGDAGGK